MLRKIILFKLKFFAKRILAKYKPKIVGITGSVGKTSAREAIGAVLSAKFRVRPSLKNYNNEFGLPLSIIGAESPARNIFGWLAVFGKACQLLLIKDKAYPEILVLEMGVDKPGDMDYLNSITSCDVGVITALGVAHLEAFGSAEKIDKEKAKLLENLNPKSGQAILNFDDERVKALSRHLGARVLSYGFNEGAAVKAGNLLFKFEESKRLDNLSGLTFKINYEGAMVPVILPKVVGQAAVYAALAGAAVGVAFGLNLVEIAAALKNFDSPRGRMKLISGVKRTLIIDDTYNSSPESARAAINFASLIKADGRFRKVAVMGDMLELGPYSEEGHREVGRALAKAWFDLVVTAGERSRDIDRGAKEGGMKEEQLFHFSRNTEAGIFVQDRIKEGDLILIKGSQGARMEQIVKELMAEPLKAEKLLVRQGEEWKNK
jgi:UDP-N-acetylmuramoyl-tripeptide--D-alanyl-D-alanine ligase